MRKELVPEQKVCLIILNCNFFTHPKWVESRNPASVPNFRKQFFEYLQIYYISKIILFSVPNRFQTQPITFNEIKNTKDSNDPDDSGTDVGEYLFY